MFSPANVYNVFILSVVIFISVYRYARVMYVCHQDSRESGSRHCLHKTVVGIGISAIDARLQVFKKRRNILFLDITSMLI